MRGGILIPRGESHMEKHQEQKLARVVWVLVSIVFVCNIIAIFLVPSAVMTNQQDVLHGAGNYLGGIFAPGEDDIQAAGVMASLLCWFWVWQEAYSGVLALFLIFCGVCTAVIIYQGRRILATILAGTPFCVDNAVSLRRAAVCCFLIAAAALARLIWGLFWYRSAAPLVTYNALFIPIFLMGGLLCLVMSALFRQAARMREENDLTI